MKNWPVVPDLRNTASELRPSHNRGRAANTMRVLHPCLPKARRDQTRVRARATHAEALLPQGTARLLADDVTISGVGPARQDAPVSRATPARAWPSRLGMAL